MFTASAVNRDLICTSSPGLQCRQSTGDRWETISLAKTSHASLCWQVIFSIFICPTFHPAWSAASFLYCFNEKDATKKKKQKEQLNLCTIRLTPSPQRRLEATSSSPLGSLWLIFEQKGFTLVMSYCAIPQVGINKVLSSSEFCVSFLSHIFVKNFIHVGVLL